MAKRTGGFIGQDGLNAPDQATGVVLLAVTDRQRLALQRQAMWAVRLLLDLV